MKKIIAILFCVVLLGVSTVGQALASLTTTVVTDTSNEVNIEWIWDEQSQETGLIELNNWDQNINFMLFQMPDLNDPLINYIRLELIIEKTYPNGLTVGNGHSFSFVDDLYGLVIDDFFTSWDDNYHVIYNRQQNPLESSLTLNSTNAVPVPAAVWLLGSGLVGVIGLRRKYKK